MYADLALAELVPNPDQPRQHFDEEALAELAASIRTSGLLQPIVVREVDGRHVIVMGERRWRACHLAPLDPVPVRVIESVSEIDAYVMSVAENVNRADMTVLEEARSYAKLISLGRTPAEVGTLFGKTPTYVTWRTGLLGLCGEVAKAVESGIMGPNVGYQTAKLSPENQTAVLTRYMRGEFATEQDASDYAMALYEREQAMPLFGEEEPPEVKAERLERSRKARAQIDRLTSLAQVLDELARTTPADLAAALDGGVAAQAAKVEDVAALALRARAVMRKARARALAGEEVPA